MGRDFPSTKQERQPLESDVRFFLLEEAMIRYLLKNHENFSSKGAERRKSVRTC